MKMEKEMKYETPEVEILEVKIELGFAGSDTSGGVPPIEIPD